MPSDGKDRVELGLGQSRYKARPQIIGKAGNLVSMRQFACAFHKISLSAPSATSTGQHRYLSLLVNSGQTKTCVPVFKLTPSALLLQTRHDPAADFRIFS